MNTTTRYIVTAILLLVVARIFYCCIDTSTEIYHNSYNESAPIRKNYR